MENGKNIQLNKIKKIYTFLLLVIPILDQYLILPITNWELFSMLGILLVVINRKVPKNTRFINYYFYLCIYAIIITLISSFPYQDLPAISLYMRLFKFIVVNVNVFYAARYFFDYNFAFKIYKKVVIIASLLFFIQYILYLFLNKCYYFLIPNLTLNYNNGINSSSLMLSNTMRVSSGYYYRPSSIFIEPAFYVSYLLPYIALALFKTKEINVKNILICAFATSTIILTTSSLGLGGALIVWGLYFMMIIRDKKNVTWLIKHAYYIIPVLSIILVFIFRQEGVLLSLIIKIKSIQNISQESSLTMRLLRGLFYFFDVDYIHKIFGLGYGNLTMYYNSVGMKTIYDAGNQVSYMSGIFTIINSFGMIGLSLFLVFVKRNYKDAAIKTKILIICLGIFMFTSDCFDSPMYYILLIFIIAENSNQNLDREELECLQ